MRLDSKTIAGEPKRGPCFSEELLESYALDLLPGNQVAKIDEHCRSCKQCREHLTMHEICMYSVKSSLGRHGLRDGVPAVNPFAFSIGSPTMTRLVTGVAASVVLIGALELSPNMRGTREAQFMPLPLPTEEIAIVNAPPEPVTLASLPPAADSEPAPVLARPVRPVRKPPILVAKMIGPRRPFIAPMKMAQVRYEKPITIEPPVLSSRASLRFPSLPGELPSLQPPAKRGVKRVLAAVGAPFRRLGSLVVGNDRDHAGGI